MNRREFLMTTLAAFALSALPKLTFAETIPVSDAVKHKIDPKINSDSALCGCR